MIQAQSPFTLLERRFDGPAHAGDPDQHRDWGVCWGITEIDLSSGFSPNARRKTIHTSGPGRPARTATPRLTGELGHEGSFAALFDQVGLPPVRGYDRGELIDTLRRWGSGDHARLSWPAATARPGGTAVAGRVSQTWVSWGTSA